MPIDRRLAAEARRLGELLVTRSIPSDEVDRIRTTLADINDRVAAAPSADKIDMFGGQQRIKTFLETGVWPSAPPDQSEIEFDVGSFVGGALNPASVGVRFWRDGDDAIGRACIGRLYEGPPGRAHGGIICAIFDEVMGSAFRALGSPSGYTGELSVRFEGPAPLDTELEFRCRQVGTNGRKMFVEGEATGPEGRFASATATFIEMRPDSVSGLAGRA